MISYLLITFLLIVIYILFKKRHKFHFFRKKVAICCLCDTTLCEDCIQTIDNLTFCKKHGEIFTEKTWIEYICTLTCADFSDNGIKLYDFRTYLYKRFKIPTYFIVKYQINNQSNQIDSIVTMHINKEDLKKVSEEAINFLT